MKINKVHLLFEQSGTFKNEFKKLGIQAEDYDILDDFGETDHITDLFAEINKAYDNKPSMFDEIGKDDLVFAFFPCTRFEVQIIMSFRGDNYNQKTWDDSQKLDYCIKLHEELHELYVLISKLFAISIRGGWRMVVENPYSSQHYLAMYFPIKPAIIDNDRRLNGDYFKKPTQYWFVNCKPEQNMFLESLEYIQTASIERVERLDVNQDRKVKRSLLHPQYARRFIMASVSKGDLICPEKKKPIAWSWSRSWHTSEASTSSAGQRSRNTQAKATSGAISI